MVLPEETGEFVGMDERWMMWLSGVVMGWFVWVVFFEGFILGFVWCVFLGLFFLVFFDSSFVKWYLSKWSSFGIMCLKRFFLW